MKKLPAIKSLDQLAQLAKHATGLQGRYTRLAVLAATNAGKDATTLAEAFQVFDDQTIELPEKQVVAGINDMRDMEWQEAKEAAEIVGSAAAQGVPAEDAALGVELDGVRLGKQLAEIAANKPKAKKAKPAKAAKKAKPAPKAKPAKAPKAEVGNRAKRYTEADMRKFVALLKKKSLAAIKREFGISRHTLRKFRDAK